MPVQSMREAPVVERAIATQPHGMRDRRALILLATLLGGLLAFGELRQSFMGNGVDLLDAAILALSFALFAWIAFGFIGAVAGFLVLVGGGPGASPRLGPLSLPRGRTAVLLPVYNEDVDAVFGRLRQMVGSVDGIGARDLFDFFVLSDSAEENEARERAAFLRLRATSPVPVYYRRRPINHARKPGNIEDWVTRFGGGYDYMIVLDADSLMSGGAMARLAALMDRQPGLGLVQTIPSLINSRTPFARWQQFAARLYGPIASAGLHWWSGAESTFWGHNAIVRVKAFAESCGLPCLPGRAPFGGHIMSHDMVEAALLRRRGWSVHMVSLPDGSHEEYPPTLVDHAVRDRRWCQGNLQHIRLLASGGFHWVNRLQLLIGASAYITSPLWLMLLIASLVQSFRMGGFVEGFAPSGWLIALTVLFLFGPKLLSVIWAWMDKERLESFGGRRALLKGVATEIPLSILTAPIMMLTQTMAVLDIVRGRPGGWLPQRRDVDGMSLREAARAYIPHMLLGWGFVVAFLIGGGALVWSLPVAAGLVVAPVVVSLTSRVSLGEKLEKRGVFVTASEDGLKPEPVPAPVPADLAAPPRGEMVVPPRGEKGLSLV